MYAEVAWVLVSSRTQVQSQVILDPDYLPDHLSVSYDYDNRHHKPAKVFYSAFSRSCQLIFYLETSVSKHIVKLTVDRHLQVILHNLKN